jgi:hypothetical protein
MSATPEERARNFVKRWFADKSSPMKKLAENELAAVIRDGAREAMLGGEDSISRSSHPHPRPD